jgi:hypothetical protein
MKLLKIFLLEKDLEDETLLNWKCFQEVPIGMTKIGEPKIMIHLEHIQSRCLEYLDFMGPKLQQFVIHNFVVTWQDYQYRLCMKNQSLDCLVSCVDFAENYSFMEHNEIQTQHWHNFQITILVHLTWRINPTFRVRDDENTRVITDYHFYILDD